MYKTVGKIRYISTRVRARARVLPVHTRRSYRSVQSWNDAAFAVRYKFATSLPIDRVSVQYRCVLWFHRYNVAALSSCTFTRRRTFPLNPIRKLSSVRWSISNATAAAIKSCRLKQKSQNRPEGLLPVTGFIERDERALTNRHFRFFLAFFAPFSWSSLNHR